MNRRGGRSERSSWGSNSNKVYSIVCSLAVKKATAPLDTVKLPGIIS